MGNSARMNSASNNAKLQGTQRGGRSRKKKFDASQKASLERFFDDLGQTVRDEENRQLQLEAQDFSSRKRVQKDYKLLLLHSKQKTLTSDPKFRLSSSMDEEDMFYISQDKNGSYQVSLKEGAADKIEEYLLKDSKHIGRRDYEERLNVAARALRTLAKSGVSYQDGSDEKTERLEAFDQINKSLELLREAYSNKPFKLKVGQDYDLDELMQINVSQETVTVKEDVWKQLDADRQLLRQNPKNKEAVKRLKDLVLALKREEIYKVMEATQQLNDYYDAIVELNRTLKHIPNKLNASGTDHRASLDAELFEAKEVWFQKKETIKDEVKEALNQLYEDIVKARENKDYEAIKETAERYNSAVKSLQSHVETLIKKDQNIVRNLEQIDVQATSFKQKARRRVKSKTKRRRKRARKMKTEQKQAWEGTSADAKAKQVDSDNPNRVRSFSNDSDSSEGSFEVERKVGEKRPRKGKRRPSKRPKS